MSEQDRDQERMTASEEASADQDAKAGLTEDDQTARAEDAPDGASDEIEPDLTTPRDPGSQGSESPPED